LFYHLIAYFSLGIVAGGGRIDKPILKAGRNYHKFKAKRKSWPRVRGVAMNVSASSLPFFYLMKFFLSSLLTIHSVVVIINTLVNHQLSVVMLHPVEKSVLLPLVELVVYVVPSSPKKIKHPFFYPCTRNIYTVFVLKYHQR
jgi:hypothetical protein